MAADLDREGGVASVDRRVLVETVLLVHRQGALIVDSPGVSFEAEDCDSA